MRVPAPRAEAAGALLEGAGATGFSVADAETEPALGDAARVTAWLPITDPEAPELELARRLAPAGADRIRIREEPDPGWADAWRAWFVPVRAGRRLLVLPPWREAAPEDADRLKLVIEPGMAFGTGGHATTLLCLAALEAAQPAGSTVLDVGTGSGVLAVAAARLGAARVVAIDDDPVAVEAARDNVAENGVGGVVEVGADWPEVGFDLVVANIVAPTLLELRERLVAATRRRLVLSGVLAGEADRVVAAFAAAGLGLERRDAIEADADWVALTLTR